MVENVINTWKMLETHIIFICIFFNGELKILNQSIDLDLTMVKLIVTFTVYFETFKFK